MEDTKSAPKGKKGLSARKEKRYAFNLRIRPTTEQAQDDLHRFIMGQLDNPDAPLVLDEIVRDIHSLMDDELITALEMLEDHFNYDHEHRRQEEANAVFPAHLLLTKLRDLQKARLRDAIERLVKPGRQ